VAVRKHVASSEDAWERAVEATAAGTGSLFDPWVQAAPALLEFIDER
jgi:2-hydroxy-6-oxonona-2,4-dienedioate hydrolase